jgi:hypothetical protein
MSQTKRVDWSEIDTNQIRAFASGKISGKEFYRLNVNTKTGGIVRQMLRDRGVDEARELARKVLYRR